MIKETSVSDLKKIWNKYNNYYKLDQLLQNLRENDGIEIKDWLHIPIHLKFIKKELSKLDKNKSKILEAGCGIGHWVFWMTEQGFETTGVDLSPKAIFLAKDYAKKNKIKDCKFIKGDVRKLPIEDNYFDLVFSFGLIEHFRNPEVILEEFKRVLKPGGILFLSAPNQYSSHTITRAILKSFNKWSLGYERSYDSKSMDKLFQKCGLETLYTGIMPGGELFGRGISRFPVIGNHLFKLLSKISFFIESHQNIFGFWIYGVAEKKD